MLVLRLWGQYFFIPESSLSMGGMFLLSIVFLPLLVYGLLQKVQPQQRIEAAIWLTIPSMLLDVMTTYFFAQAIPNVSPLADGAFGAWLLWGYAIVLSTGLVASRSRSLRYGIAQGLKKLHRRPSRSWNDRL
ncbi:MAG: DUF5367 domain-containing protein [Microcoleus sp. SIO2G3]|nr:DUF5367 domain-containing protein [Microcoleus sp. SIO2G3]